jgi:uncharacterized protein (TIGR02996 family)
MTDLLAMILRDPDDDHARQVYGDWVAEHGDAARAELIRWQCELARLPAWDRRAIVASWEAEALLARHGARWRGELPALDGVTWGELHRGFAASVRVADVATLYKHAAAIGAAAPVWAVEMLRLDESRTPAWECSVPWLRVLRLEAGYQRDHAPHRESSLLSRVPELEIRVRDAYAQFEWLWLRDADVPLRRLVVDGEHIVGRGFAAQLVHMSWVEDLAELSLATRFVDYDSGYYEDPTLRLEGAQEIAAAKLLALKTLAIDRQRVTSEGLAALIESLPGLHELTAHGCELEDLGFLRSSLGEPLVRLALGGNAIGNDGARAIAEARRTATLERLDLDTCEIGPPGLAALVEGRSWRTLRWLDLSRNPLGERGALELATGRTPPQLHTLLLADVDFTASDAAAVLALPWMRELLALDLSNNQLDGAEEALAELAKGGLRKLALVKTQLEAEGCAALAPLWSTLVHLALGDNPLRAKGVKALIAAGEAAQLQTLDLRWTSLHDHGFAALAKARCPRLRTLVLAGNRPTIDGVVELLRSPLIAHLELLDLSRCELTADAAAVIAASPQLANLMTLELQGNTTFGETELLALARSPHLASVELKLTGEPWKMAVPVREELERRFGRNWYWHDGDDEDEEQDEDEA